MALWQAEFVRTTLIQHYPDLTVKLLGLKTIGDILLDQSLDKLGGKGVFVKELEHALLSGEADLAVHSLKDVPAFFPAGLGLAAVCVRENPLDAWICPAGASLENLPAGSRVGTSSLRRCVQLQHMRPDLVYLPLRGNVGTRLEKCQRGEYEAIVLAHAGLSRLHLTHVITQVFSPLQLLPAVGQGALGIECRLENASLRALLSVLDHAPTRRCVYAERAMNARLGGSCQVPVAGFAQEIGDKIVLTGRVGDPDSGRILEARSEGELTAGEAIGEQVALDLIAQGAQAIIDKLSAQSSHGK